MGLDQWLFTVKPEVIMDAEVDFVVADGETSTELAYWRKHPDLHGWMERLYREKGGADPDFNVSTVRLEMDDLDELESDVRNHLLPHTTGFFFGASSDEDIEPTLRAIEAARVALLEGMAVYYTSWW